ncbi:MAG: choice-of-anchor J domain-containing protein [Bacteroidia bacterium]|nr:choice-of-anchor J domain-containing protein [Bacteroidia bacterium]NND24908.1 T9SS type A sorting domain-containing protein [Flavobacteriaceae bacterium]MBT8279053.1 choice-of-anchor J domain-containing protein [Bacteroidia bacterium]NNK59953.1 T9SS type A sorting domain-containing protein [Flavobacteriaceae bacterium]NNL33094.1 T9SS type A sorting domain-containing protein [Flavobacteriaceae bacterium]
MNKITLLLFSFLALTINAQTVLFSDDFEGEAVDATTYTNWVAFDQDGDTEFFEVADITGSTVEASPLVGLVADSDSWESGNPNSPMTPNNYLITANPIDLTGATDGLLEFTFGTYQNNGTFLEDQLAVYISTSNDPTVIETETAIYDATVGSATPADNGGANSAVDISLDISAFEGQNVYIAFRHYNTFDHNSVLLDNVVVSSLVLSVEEFSAPRIKHTFNNDTKVLTLDSNVMLSELAIYNILGQESLKVGINNTDADINLSNLEAGIYIAKIIGNNNASKTIKLVVK